MCLPGLHRIQHFGAAKPPFSSKLRQFQGCTKEFLVTCGRWLQDFWGGTKHRLLCSNLHWFLQMIFNISFSRDEHWEEWQKALGHSELTEHRYVLLGFRLSKLLFVTTRRALIPSFLKFIFEVTSKDFVPMACLIFAENLFFVGNKLLFWIMAKDFFIQKGYSHSAGSYLPAPSTRWSSKYGIYLLVWCENLGPL